MEQTGKRAAHGPEEFYEEVYSIVRQIPPGKVLTYGAIARMMGRPRHARLVGRALWGTPSGRGIPCHRVVNAAGRTAPGWDAQRTLLEAEGVRFRPNGCADLARSGWDALSGLSGEREKPRRRSGNTRAGQYSPLRTRSAENERP